MKWKLQLSEPWQISNYYLLPIPFTTRPLITICVWVITLEPRSRLQIKICLTVEYANAIVSGWQLWRQRKLPSSNSSLSLVEPALRTFSHSKETTKSFLNKGDIYKYYLKTQALFFIKGFPIVSLYHKTKLFLNNFI